MQAKLRREAAFPRYLLEIGVSERDVESAEASKPADRTRILQALGEASSIGEVNARLKGQLAAAGLNIVLGGGESEEEEAQRQRFVTAVRAGRVRTMGLSFEPVSTQRHTAALASVVEAADPASLVELRLIGLTHVASVPPRLIELEGLTHLALCDATLITGLPAELGSRLTRLRTLDLSGARDMEELPQSIADVATLEELLLAGCASLTKLPEQLGGAAAFAVALEAKEEAEEEAREAAEAAGAEAADELGGGSVGGVAGVGIGVVGVVIRGVVIRGVGFPPAKIHVDGVGVLWFV